MAERERECYPRHFTRTAWFALPLAVRQRWWRETEYGARPPSPELIALTGAVQPGAPRG